MREGRTTSVENPPVPFITEIKTMPLTHVLKKSLARRSTQSGSSRWAALGLIWSMTACTSLTAADLGLPVQPVVGIGVQQQVGIFDAAGQAFTKELGAHSIRVAYKHGNHDFGVNWAAQNGVGVLFMLGYGSSGPSCNPTTPSGRQCYADRSAALAQKYGNKVQYYEIWNEWNGHFGPYGSHSGNRSPVSIAAYTDLLCRTYRAIKAVAPNAKIVSGATSGTDIEWNGKILDAGGKNCMDAISVHPYVYLHTRFSVPANSPGSVGAAKFIEAVTAVDTMVRQKTGRSIPILVTEEGRRDGGTAAGEQITADFITQIYKRAQSLPFIEGIWWYPLEDYRNGDGWGLLRKNNTKKPAFAAFRAAAKK